MISTNRSQSIVAAAEMFQMHSVMTPGVIFLQQMGLGPLVLDISIMSAIIQLVCLVWRDSDGGTYNTPDLKLIPEITIFSSIRKTIESMSAIFLEVLGNLVVSCLVLPRSQINHTIRVTQSYSVKSARQYSDNNNLYNSLIF